MSNWQTDTWSASGKISADEGFVTVMRGCPSVENSMSAFTFKAGKDPKFRSVRAISQTRSPHPLLKATCNKPTNGLCNSATMSADFFAAFADTIAASAALLVDFQSAIVQTTYATVAVAMTAVRIVVGSLHDAERTVTA